MQSSSKVIFVSGGASGLGRATVKHMLSLNFRVAAADLSTENLSQLKLEANTPNLITFQCDVTVESNVKEAVEATVLKWNKIDVCVTCAGILMPMLTLTSKTSLNAEKFKKILDVNVMGSIYVAKYVSIEMAK